jgi:hypothetical protein
LLSDKGFGNAASADYLLRAYAVEFDWRREKNGTGSVNVLDWVGFADPYKHVNTAIQNAATRTRYLTGADFNPVALARMADNSLWMAEAKGPSLLHFSKDGALLEAPRAIRGGDLVAMSGSADGVLLLLGVRAGDKIAFQFYDPGKDALVGKVFAYALDAADRSLSEVALINARQAVAVEQDSKQGAEAKVKLVYLIEFADDGNARKTPLADLLNVADPASIATSNVFGPTAGQFGLKPFSFPYQDVSSVYPIDASTLVVANNNHFPFGHSRNSQVADYTELIAIKLPKALDVQLTTTQE